MFFCLKAQNIFCNTRTLYIKQAQCGTMKPIISVKLMNMPTINEKKAYLQQLVQSEMSASAVSQFNAEAEYRNGLYTANIFFCTKKTMIMFTWQEKENILPPWSHQMFSHICQWFSVNKFFESNIFRYVTKVKPASYFWLWTRFLGGKVAWPWSLLMIW